MSTDEFKVFIVDDDEGVRCSLALLLESHGMEVEAYGSTEEFAQSYGPHAQACLILDQHLPGSTGLDFLTSDEWTRFHLPVILVTGRGDSALKARACRAGVSTYLEKPIDETQLMTAIRNALAARPKGT